MTALALKNNSFLVHPKTAAVPTARDVFLHKAQIGNLKVGMEAPSRVAAVSSCWRMFGKWYRVTEW